MATHADVVRKCHQWLSENFGDRIRAKFKDTPFLPKHLYPMAVLFMVLVVSSSVDAGEKGPSPEETEVKFAVRPADIVAAKEKLHLKKPATESICFFDTGDRQLEKRDLSLRSRYVVSGEDGGKAPEDDKHNGTTAKLRQAAGIDRVKEKAFIDSIQSNSSSGKIERDETVGKSAVESLSLDSTLMNSQIKVVEDSKSGMEALFQRQQSFINAHGGVDWSKVQVIGPIVSTKWGHISLPEVPTAVFDVEEWVVKLPGRPALDLMEISSKQKGDANTVSAFGLEMSAALGKLGFTEDPGAEMKTAAVFEYYLNK